MTRFKLAQLNRELAATWNVRGQNILNGYGDIASTFESKLHEICHWFALGYDKRPRGDLSIDAVVASKLEGIAPDDANDQEMVTVAIELNVMRRLDIEHRFKQRKIIINAFEGLKAEDPRFSADPDAPTDEWVAIINTACDRFNATIKALRNDPEVYRLSTTITNVIKELSQ